MSDSTTLLKFLQANADKIAVSQAIEDTKPLRAMFEHLSAVIAGICEMLIAKGVCTADDLTAAVEVCRPIVKAEFDGRIAQVVEGILAGGGK